MNFDPPERQQLVAIAHALADAARTETLKYFRASGVEAENKPGGRGFDPVTVADRAAEAAMRDILGRERPDDGILGEEYGSKPGTSGLTWVLDPIDGTRSYISGSPVWGVLVGLDAGDGPVLGLVDQPFIGERFLGAFGEATYHRGDIPVPISTRACKNLSDAILFSTFPEIGTGAERAGFEAVAERARLTRYGMDCYAYAMLAMGQIDLVVEAGLHAFDIQGPQGLIEAAGGVVSNWQGGPVHMGGRVLAAGDPALHAQALEILSRVPEDS
jgi:histidinol phosphatase-like enzyme (inositol monophosphatase family)